MIDLYTDATPNGLKISIALEELALEYKAHRIYLGGDQMTAEFTAMNPNQKIPVLKDGDITVSESGAILTYLAEKTGRLLPSDLAARTKVFEMLMLQMSGLGPNFGQLIVWAGPWANKIPQATTRYSIEVSRLLSVLDKHLDGQEYMAAGQYTIADIAFFPWIRMCHIHPIGQALSVERYKNIGRWYDRISTREAVQRGLLVPEPHDTEKQGKAFFSAVVGLGDLHKPVPIADTDAA